MFGYVTVTKEQLGEADYADFCAYYCGLCKAMGRNCSQASRLSLSYDMTFLAILLSAVYGDSCDRKKLRCGIHPRIKREYVKKDSALDYSANMGVMLSYLKMRDDLHDDHSIKAFFAMLVLYRGVRKARKRYPDEYKYINECLDKLSILENENCGDIDVVSDCFAKITERLFVPEMISDSDTKKILAWLGYNLGRWIYIIDAVNDMEKDLKSKSYNPFLAEYAGDFSEYKISTVRKQSVTLTIALKNIAGAFDLLKVHRNHELLYKIVYGILYLKQNSILKRLTETGENDGSI